MKALSERRESPVEGTATNAPALALRERSHCFTVECTRARCDDRTAGICGSGQHDANVPLSFAFSSSRACCCRLHCSSACRCCTTHKASVPPRLRSAPAQSQHTICNQGIHSDAVLKGLRAAHPQVTAQMQSPEDDHLRPSRHVHCQAKSPHQ